LKTNHCFCAVVDSFIGSTLALKNLRRPDMGTYLCIAANGIPPTKSRRYEVTVHFEPVVKVSSPVVLRSVDMQVTLQCFVEAAPKSLNTWQRGKSQAETPQRTTTTTTTTTTSTTPRPTTTLPSTTRPPKRHKPKQHVVASQNALDNELRQVEINNALNFYNSAFTTNNSQQRTERHKIKPTVSPRQYTDYNINAGIRRCVNAALAVVSVAVLKLFTM
ncbi:Lachesin, partial [Operophtera brumata]